MTSFLRLSEAPEEFHTVLSTFHAYQCAYFNHCTAYSLLALIFSWNKILYLLILSKHKGKIKFHQIWWYQNGDPPKRGRQNSKLFNHTR